MMKNENINIENIKLKRQLDILKNEDIYMENIKLNRQLNILKEVVEYYADNKRTILEETISGYRNVGGKAYQALVDIENIKLNIEQK